MTLHKEGKLIVWISIALLFITIMTAVWSSHWIPIALTAILIVWTGFVLYFFRNPERPLTENPDGINCPADGKVVVIEKTYEPEYFKDERWQISIFMSPLNVHLNRIPITGEVIHYKYHPGKYLVAWHPKSSTKNERNTIVIEDPKGQKLLVRQIAGAVARRIVCHLNPGMKIRQGDELGFIKFGSRVDVFLPLDAVILVQPGQTVKGNVDVLARWA